MSCVLRARTHLEDGKKLGAGVDDQPEHVSRAAQSGSQFIQLEVREPEMAEGPLVQGLCMFKSPSEPGGDRGLSKAEDALSGRWVEPLGQRREHHCDLVGGGFQSVERSIASSTERGAAGRTSNTGGSDRRSPPCSREWRAPRRLFTSDQGRTGAEADLTRGEGVQARRQAGQSSGQRGDAADGGAWCAWPCS